MCAVERRLMMFPMEGFEALMEKSLDNSFSRRKAAMQHVAVKKTFD
jgi:hypothetical protein